VNVLPDIWCGFLLAMAVSATRGRLSRGWLPFIIGAAAGGLLAGLLSGRWDEAGFCAAALAVLAWDRWNKRGRKVAKLIGAKGRAVLAAVVEKAREAGTPLPEGARA
jgi:hypothetical protein